MNEHLDYPRLAAAAVEIYMDNGVLISISSIDDALRYAQTKHAPAAMLLAEQDLSRLSGEDLETLSTGEEEDCPHSTQDVLTTLFEAHILPGEL